MEVVTRWGICDQQINLMDDNQEYEFGNDSYSDNCKDICKYCNGYGWSIQAWQVTHYSVFPPEGQCPACYGTGKTVLPTPEESRVIRADEDYHDWVARGGGCMPWKGVKKSEGHSTGSGKPAQN